MKKMMTVIMALMLVVFALPLMTVGLADMQYEPRMADGNNVASGDTLSPDDEDETGQPGDAVSVDGTQGAVSQKSYDNKTYITLSHEGEPITISLHDYLIGVLAAEMPASFPEEALKAQALAARTYTLYKIKLYEDGMEIPAEHNGAQMCDDFTHCKAYCDIEEHAVEMWGENAAFYLDKITKAVEATDGIIAIYEGEPIAAVFHAASTEKTEAAVDVWGTDTPYLISVDSPGGEESPSYNTVVTMSQSDFAEKVVASYPAANLDIPPEEWFKDSNRSEAGGVINVAVGGVRVLGTFIREITGLNSTNFRVRVEGDDLVFTSIGYGHGVGMSQYGAKALALEGYAFDEIIKHYFVGVDLLLKS